MATSNMGECLVHRPTSPGRTIAVLTAIVALAGCSGGGATPSTTPSEAAASSGTTQSVSPAAQKPLKITLLTTYNGLPFYTAMYCGTLAAAKELGGQIEITSEGPPHGMNVAEQLPILTAAINAKPDGMILVPADARALVATVQKAMADGLPIVTTDQALEQEVAIAHYGADNKAGGKLAADEMLKLVGDQSGYILVLDNRTGLPVTNLRADGFIEGIKANTKLTLLETQYNADDPNKAATQTQAALLAHPDLLGVFATGAMGAASALKAVTGTKPHVVAYDAGPTLVRALRDGDFDALIAQGSYGQGHDSMTTLVKYIRGEITKVDPYNNNIPNVLVTKDNIDQPDVAKFLYPDKCPGT
jgi:ribose transport system substrate-binding protein